MQCKAKSKRSGQQCRRKAMIGKEVCMIHGGKSPRGMESPHFKTGRYSNDAPARLNARYLAGLEDPELTSLRDEIAMVDARTSDLLKMASISGEHQSLVDAREVLDAIFAIDNDSPTARQKFEELLRSLHGILHRVDDTETWIQINKNFELRSKLVTSELSRLKIADQFLTVAEATMMEIMMYQAATETISNQAELRAFGKRLREIIERTGKRVDAA